MQTRSSGIIEWMKGQVSAAGARGIAVGLSGGIDSAVVVGLGARATPGHVIGVIMPCHSDPTDEAHANLVAAHFNVKAVRIDLAPAYDHLFEEFHGALGWLERFGIPPSDEVDIKARLPLANVKPRLRMTTLYFVANMLNYLVAGTGNRTELAIGYFTKYGDGGVDMLPIGGLLKSEVRQIARELGVPAEVIDKAPSAGLWTGQTDETEMGFTYDELERYLTKGAGSVDAAVAARIERLARSSEHKRALPPTPPR
jgi:NAD+ synthase